MGLVIRLPSSPLTTPVKSRVCGVAQCLGNKQVTKIAYNANKFLINKRILRKGERLNGVLLVKIL